MTAVLVAIFGGLGAVARAEVSERYGTARGIAVANLAGSALLGLVLGLVAGGTIGSGFGRILGVGFAAGFTTFSTWIVLAAVDPQKHAPRLAGQLVAGMLVAGVGWSVGWLFPF